MFLFLIFFFITENICTSFTVTIKVFVRCGNDELLLNKILPIRYFTCIKQKVKRRNMSIEPGDLLFKTMFVEAQHRIKNRLPTDPWQIYCARYNRQLIRTVISPYSNLWITLIGQMQNLNRALRISVTTAPFFYAYNFHDCCDVSTQWLYFVRTEYKRWKLNDPQS